jgi:DNA-binding transcriptional regulator YdaS (Cro superfamily)
MNELKAWLDGERGRRTALAATLGITPGALSQWAQVPSERALDVERATGISRYSLRPDVFGQPEAAA